jgi:inositol phosphorylceramide mannosyltransferase catalytic subunit
MITKKIYQTWVTKNLPHRVKDYVDEMLSLNPSYEYELYDDEDIFYFIQQHYGKDILSTYEKLNIGAAKSDLWRYLILYKQGGIYLDIDSHIHKNLDGLIKESDRAIISREGNQDTFVQWCLMFSKEHPILERTIEKCVYNIKNETTENILELTGPQVYSSAIQETLSPLSVDVYKSSDMIVANKMKSDEFDDIRCRLYSYDYEDYCIFKHRDSYLLNTDKPHWREESETRSVFKAHNYYE